MKYTLLTLTTLLTSATAITKTIHINRHGEKTWAAGCLDDQGNARANYISTDVYNGQVFDLPDVIYACRYKDPIDCERCKETVTPLSEVTGIPIIFDYGYRLVLGGNGGAAKAMIEKLGDENVNNIVVAWEHNNINKLAKALGASASDLPIWEDSDYDSIYVMTFEDGVFSNYEKKAENFPGLETPTLVGQNTTLDATIDEALCYTRSDYEDKHAAHEVCTKNCPADDMDCYYDNYLQHDHWCCVKNNDF